jgi:hypothetical protein
MRSWGTCGAERTLAVVPRGYRPQGIRPSRFRGMLAGGYNVRISTKITFIGEFMPAPGPSAGDLSTGGILHVRTMAVSLGALALTAAVAGCSAAAQQGQSPSTTPGTSTSAPAAAVTPAAGITTASAPSPSATDCLTPDIAGDNATAARSAVQTAGFQVVVVTKADPDEPSFPGGLVWGGNPPLDETRAPCGSTVTVYIQPGTTP